MLRQVWNALTLGLCALLAGATPALAQGAKETYPQVLQLQGKLSQPTGAEMAELAPQVAPKPGVPLQVGADGDAYKKPGILQEQGAILSFSPQDLVILPQGSQGHLELESKTPHYKLRGFSFLLLKPQPTSRKLLINGLPWETKAGALLYLVATDTTQQWTLIEGEATTWLPQPAKEQKPQPALKVILRTGERVVKTGEEATLERNPEYQDAQYQAALRPGFSQLGAYAWVGYASFEGKGLKVVRLGKEALLTGSPVPLFAGDEVTTQAGQKAQIELKPSDLIRLEPNASFVLPPAEQMQEKTQSFTFIGQIRAKLAKREAGRSAAFRSVTATIGVKGTDFFALASETGTEAGTLEGLVGVSDAQGQGEVLVEPGMQTKVNKGEAPQKPERIPPQRLQELNNSALKANLLADLVGKGPQLWPPYQLEQTTLKETDKLTLTFDAPLESLGVKLKGKEIPATLAEDKKSAALDVSALFAAAAKQPKVALEITLKGPNTAGNSLTKELRLLQKPEKPPVLTLPLGKSLLEGQKITVLTVKADRDITQWDLDLDGKPLPPVLAAAAGGEDAATLKLVGGWLAELTSGTHIVLVKGTDGFAMTSEALTLTLKIDQDAPFATGLQLTRRPNSALAPLLLGSLAVPPAADAPAKPLSLDGLELREGEGMTIQVNEAAAEAVLEVQGQTLTLTPNESKTLFVAKPEELSRLFANEAKFTLRLRDSWGNEQAQAGQVRFVWPQAALLSWGFAGDRHATKGDQDLTWQSDRPVERWELLINNKSQNLQGVMPMPPFVAQQKLVLPASLFKDLSEGEAQLQITAWDDFQKPANLRLTLVVDRTAPRLLRLVPAKHLEWFSLKEGETLRLEFDEELAEVKASLGAQAWKLEISPDKRALLLVGNAGLLGAEAKELTLEVSDQVGNSARLLGWARNKPVGSGPLRDAYDQTTLRKGVGDGDAGLLLLRLPFDPSREKSGLGANP